MKIIKHIIPILTATLLVSGIVWAAAVFPGALDNFSTGDVLEAEDVNAIQATIGITGSASTTSHYYMIHDRPTYAYASSTYYQLSAWYSTTTDGLTEGSTNLYWTTTTNDYWGSQRAHTAITWSASGFAITADGVGDTQLTFNTGQHLTSTSYPTFSGVNLTYGINVATSTITYTTGNLTGNASTSSALLANGANCNAGEYALGIDASGAVESCTDATTEINTVVNALGGTNLTCASQSCNVDDSFLLNTGDIGTGVYDFGGATSLEIPNSATLQVGTLGQIGIDTTSDTIQYQGSATRTIAYWHEKCLSMASTTWQGMTTSTIVWRPYKAIEIIQTSCDNGGTLTDQGTTTLKFSDGTNDMDTATCGYTQSKDTSLSNSTWIADEAMIWTLLTDDGTANYFNYCIVYIITED